MPYIRNTGGESLKGLYVDLLRFAEAVRSETKASLAHVSLFICRAHAADDARAGILVRQRERVNHVRGFWLLISTLFYGARQKYYWPGVPLSELDSIAVVVNDALYIVGRQII